MLPLPLAATAPLASCPPQAHPRTLLHQPNKPSSSPSFLLPADAHLPAAAPIPDHTRPAEVSTQLQLQPLASNLLGPLSALVLARSRSPQSSAVNASSFNQQSVLLCFRPHHLGRPSGGAWNLRVLGLGPFPAFVPSTDLNLNLVTRHCATADPYTVTQPKLLVFQLLHAQSATSYD